MWRPKEKSEPVEQKDKRKIVVCDRTEKKSRKYGDESGDDSDDDKFTSKGKKLKSKSNKPEWKLTRCSSKVKR
jgi:DNA damage-binding protein 2